MGLETGTYISDLDATNPTAGDLISAGDDHLRLLKSVLKTTFPNINGAVTVTPEQLNYSSAATGKNRIINGAMTIDQRNAGASVIPAHGSYVLDRWECFNNPGGKYSVQQNAGSATPPAGFANYFGVTSLSAYTIAGTDSYTINQKIEGFNFADMAWGTASAATITLSFWVRSSLTGTFGGALRNSADTRSYPFTYTILAANTFEYKTITITGDTSGTWVGATNGVGLRLFIGLGVGSSLSGTPGAWSGSTYYSATGATSVVGTSGATFYITGVQLEKGSTATPFEYRQYGTELALCQRYYETSYSQGTAIGSATYDGYVGGSRGSGGWPFTNVFRVEKRAVPTMTIYSPATGTSGKVRADGSGDENGTATATTSGCRYSGIGSTVGQAYGVHYVAISEL